VGAAAVLILGLLPLLFSQESTRDRALNTYWTGMAYAHDAMGSAATREFDRSLAYDPDSPLPRLAVADLLQQDQVYDEAIRELEAVREAHPDLVAPLLPLARLYERRERWSEAAVIHQALIALDPENPEFHNGLAVAYGAAGFLNRAEAEFRKALALDPDNAAAKNNLAGMQQAGLATADSAETELGPQAVMALIRDQRLAAAESVLALSYRQAGADSSQLLFLEGTLHFKKQEFNQAVAVFEALRPKYEKNPMFMHNLAAAYASVGRFDEALGIWSDLVRAKPENQVFRASLAQAEQQVLQAAMQARGAQAHALWDMLVRHFPRKADYADSLAAHP